MKGWVGEGSYGCGKFCERCRLKVGRCKGWIGEGLRVGIGSGNENERRF